MKRILFLATVLLTCLSMSAGQVDATAARSTLLRYLHQANSTGRHMAPSRANDVQLVHTEVNPSINNQAVYYIFNTSDSYYIVSGDDRAREILAHGDQPIDMDNIPANMQVWLDSYKEQLEYLQAHPDMQVQQGPRRAPAQSANSVAPLLTALWDQEYPYNLECPVSNGRRCLTGCPATSLAMVFYYWKYPTGTTPSVSGYTTQSLGLQLESLPPTTFDWDNMLDRYRGGYNGNQASAVAHLMRYLGQAERMDYTPEASGSYGENIVQTIKLFGYDQDVRIIYKDGWGSNHYSDDEWAALIQEELENGRPIVMCAYTSTWSGHAFNIDGYDASDDTYHINWGWSGSSNANFALNAFRGGTSMYNVNQQLIVGIEPPATVPTIKSRSTRLNLKAYEDSTAVASFTVKGALLTHDVTLTLNDPNGVFELETRQISRQNLNAWYRVFVRYKPTQEGSHTATIVLSSEDAEDKVIHLNGTCLLETYNPVMMDATDVTQSSFNVQWNDVTPKQNVASYNLEVAPVPFHEERLAESFDKTEYPGTSTSDCSSKLDEITATPGWSGSKLFRANNNLLMGTSKSGGWIETPALDMYGNNHQITVMVTARSSNSDIVAPLKITCGENESTLEITSDEFATYSVMLPCHDTEEAKAKLSNAAGKRIVLKSIQIFAGDAYTPVDLTRATYLQDITSDNYVLENIASGQYGLRVQAVYINGTLSPWSNRTMVNIPWQKGDINHDGEINIADVNQVTDAIMMNAPSVCAVAVCDLNGDGEINIADINVIINKILGDD